jgi:DNA-binding GntR family transcriptional regulator
MNQNVSLTEDTYEQIRSDLIACRLLPGQRLKTNELSERLNVSLGAVREALSRLTAEGFVVSERQRGFSAAPVSGEDLHQLTEATIDVDTVCLRRSIANGDVEWETLVVAAFHRLKRTPVHTPDNLVHISQKYSLAYSKFRFALVSACDNAWLLRVRDTLHAQTERYRQICMILGPKIPDLSAGYDELVAAVIARDADTAAALLVDRTRRNVDLLAASLAKADLLTDSADAEGQAKRRRALRETLD